MPKPIYFPQEPMDGKFAPRKFSTGIKRMAKSLREIDILGGRIEWVGDRPLIIPPEYNGAVDDREKDHSFLPTYRTPTTANVGTGQIFAANGTRFDTAASSIVDFEENTHFYVTLTYNYVTGEWPTPGAYSPGAGTTLDIVGYPSTALPVFYEIVSSTQYRVNFLLFEFINNEWSGLRRRQTNDIIDCWREYDQITGGPDTDEPWPTPPDGSTVNHPELSGLPWATPTNCGHTGDRTGSLAGEVTFAAFDVDGVAVELLGDAVAGEVQHHLLADIQDISISKDDHVADRVVVTGNRHPYIHALGDETRNSMPVDAYIGDGANKKSIYPHLRQLMAILAGVSATVEQVVVDWSLGLLRADVGGVLTTTVNWFLRQLSGGFWTVTDTTAATGTGIDTAGALIVDGGVNVKKNVIVQDDTAATTPTAAALVVVGGVGASNAILGSATDFVAVGAVGYSTLINTVTAGGQYVWIGDAAGGDNYAMNISGTNAHINLTGAYYQNGTLGITGDGFSGGIKTSAAAAETAVISATMYGGLL